MRKTVNAKKILVDIYTHSYVDTMPSAQAEDCGGRRRARMKEIPDNSFRASGTLMAALKSYSNHIN